MLMEKGKDLAAGLVRAGLASESDFPDTDTAWKSHVHRYLHRRGIKTNKAHGESGDADVEGAKEFIGNVWPELFRSVDSDPSRVWEHGRDRFVLAYLAESHFGKSGQKGERQ
eukprot:scpid97509/ scgid21209/ 